MIEALLFDVDGTLVDHNTAAAVAITKALGPDVDQAYAKRRWKELEAVAMERYLAGELTFAEQRRLRAVTLAAKPDPRIFHHACDRLGLAPREVAYVGDRRETDAVAASDAGLRGIWLDREGASGVRTLEDLPALLDAHD